MSYSTWKSTLGLMLKLPRTFKWKFPKQFNHAVFNTTFTQQRFKDAFEKLYKSGTQQRKGTYKFLGTVTFTRAFLGFFGTDDSKDPVKEHIRMGHIAVAREDFKEAENCYHLALHAGQQQFNEKKIDKRQLITIRIYVFDSLGNLALKMGDLKKAEELYKRTLKVAVQNEFFTLTDNATVEISMRLAAIYAMMGKEEETHSGFQFCIKTQEDKIKENPDESSYTYGLLGMCLENYAKFLVNAKQYDKALEYLQRAEEVVVRYLGEEHPQRIVALNDIGTVHILKEDYNKAEKVLKKALAIGHACKDETLPVLYSNLGALYLRQSKVDKALEMCKTGEKIGTEMGHSEAVKRAKFCIEKCEEEE